MISEAFCLSLLLWLMSMEVLGKLRGVFTIQFEVGCGCDSAMACDGVCMV